MKFNLTQTLAIWGAVLSSITLVWNLLRDRRDRANVKLTAMLEQTQQDSYGQSLVVEKGTASGNVGTRVVLTITNTGQRPVIIVGWGSKNASNAEARFRHVDERKGDALTEGEYHREITYELKASLLDGSVRSIFARDSTGKNWYLPRKEFRALRAEAHKLGTRYNLH